MSAYRSSDATVSAHGAAAITPNDSTVFPVTRSLYIGGSGDLTVRMADEMVVTFTAVPIGIAPFQVDKVLSPGTTASAIIGLY